MPTPTVQQLLGLDLLLIIRLGGLQRKKMEFEPHKNA